ncbi:peptidase [Roseinatronobacter alkalisoli]|uniref:Peptidase n=1 Tax=Roseinatronobacter alkalisoli TaxID=3028235 RepID=A0ABT5T886_9RHOB|nr:peptidase [Roseinatronobacter sp. HJB301]MDD7971340.1 peptidase [Roseinatronobacter sp. HJB301]
MIPAPPPNTRALEIARGWIGTPYRHRAAMRGAGADCLGLVRGVWCALYGGVGPDVPPYAPDWSERAGTEPLLLALRAHLLETTRVSDGQVLLFRMGPNAMAKHLGLQSGGGGALVHACPRAGVIEAPLSAPWARRIVARFDFPALPKG